MSGHGRAGAIQSGVKYRNLSDTYIQSPDGLTGLEAAFTLLLRWHHNIHTFELQLEREDRSYLINQTRCCNYFTVYHQAAAAIEFPGETDLRVPLCFKF